MRVVLLINRSSAHLESRCLATLSLHAVARRLQRAQDGSTAALLHDVLLVARAAGGELTAGAGYRVRTDEDGGGWRGRAIRQIGPDHRQRNVLAVRTWLPD